MAARQREAVLVWLRSALFDRTAAKAAAAAAAAGGRPGGALEEIWELITGLRREEAVEAAGEEHAYLAAVLAQPAAAVRDDLRAQLGAWRQQGAPLPPLPPPPPARLAPPLAA